MLSHVQLFHDLMDSRVLCLWDFLGKNIRIGCNFLLQGIFLTQGLNLHLLHRQVDSLSWSHQGSPKAIVCVCVCVNPQSCLTFCDPMDCSPQGSSVHGSLQARILGRVAIPVSRGSSWPRDQTQVSCIPGRFFTIWATGGAQSYHKQIQKIAQKGKMHLLLCKESTIIISINKKNTPKSINGQSKNWETVI